MRRGSLRRRKSGSSSATSSSPSAPRARRSRTLASTASIRCASGSSSGRRSAASAASSSKRRCVASADPTGSRRTSSPTSWSTPPAASSPSRSESKGRTTRSSRPARPGRLHQRARHLYAARRCGRDEGDQGRLRRARLSPRRFLDEVDDGPYLRCRRRRRGDDVRARAPRGRAPAHDQLCEPGSGLRPGLRPERGAPRPGRCRPLERDGARRTQRLRSAGTRLVIVEPRVEEYAEAHTTPDGELFERLAAETRAKTEIPQMMVGRLEGQFLAFLVRATGARCVLELGTFTGYSSISMARALPDGGRIVSCDVNEETTAIARRYAEEAGVLDRIDYRLGPAIETIET